MQKIEELKTKLADANARLTTLDEKITAMKKRQTVVAEKIASVAAELSAAHGARQEAAKNLALGTGSETDLIDSQSLIVSLAGRKSAFEAAELAISGELEKLQEPRKGASDRVDRLNDMIFEHITVLELKKAEVFVKRAYRAFFHKKTAYMSRDYFSKAVANLVHHCSHADAEKVSHELATIYELDI